MEKGEGFPKLDKVILVFAVAMAIYQLVASRFVLLPFDQHKVIHVGAAVVLVLLMLLRSKEASWTTRALLTLMIAGAAAISMYLVLNYMDMVYRMGYPQLFEVVLGIIIVLIVLETTRRTWGIVILIMLLAPSCTLLLARTCRGFSFTVVSRSPAWWPIVARISGGFTAHWPGSPRWKSFSLSCLAVS
jgi:TRAP-type uncharacterized transport system fused permease subunit